MISKQYRQSSVELSRHVVRIEDTVICTPRHLFAVRPLRHLAGDLQRTYEQGIQRVSYSRPTSNLYVFQTVGVNI
jgi:hypothetical protein